MHLSVALAWASMGRFVHTIRIWFVNIEPHNGQND